MMGMQQRQPAQQQQQQQRANGANGGALALVAGKKGAANNNAAGDDKHDEFAQLQSTSAALGKFASDARQNGQEQLELTQMLKNASVGSTETQFYYLDKFSKFRVPGVGSAVNWLPSVEAVDCCPIPRAIRTLYSQIECEMFMGLFPEINRAWITIDNRLFLWNYYKEDDFYVYDGVDQLIVSVGLARPRPGIFDADVEYIVAISTPVEVLLLQLKIVGHPVYGDIILEPTEYNMATDNVPMRSIAGTADGRIFMAGHDGSLYEFVYEAPGVLHSLGLKRQCRKVELSSAGSWLIPSFLKSLTGSPDPLVKVLVDHERSLLYTLSDRSTLSLYRLSSRRRGGEEGGSGVAAVVGSKDLTPLVRNFVSNPRHPSGRSGVRKSDLADPLRIVSLNIVRKQESESIHLVAITHLGMRIFLTTRKGEKDGSDFFVDHVRGPPNKDQQKTARQGANQGLGAGNSLSTSLLAQRHLPNARSAMEILQEGISPGPETASVVGAAVYADGVTLLANIGEGKSLPDLVSGAGANGDGGSGSANGHRNAEYSLSAFSTDLGMRQSASAGGASSPKMAQQASQHQAQQQQAQSPVPAAFPPLRWKQETYHEIVDLDVLEQGPSPRPSASDIAARRSARSLPAGRVWDMCEATFDPTVSEDEELVYGHMVYAPDPVPVRKESGGSGGSGARSTGPANRGTSGETSTLIGSKRKAPEEVSAPSAAGTGWTSTSRQMRSKVLSLSELAKQHVMPRRYFLVLTSHGLWVLVKNRPINQLYALLRGPDPGSNADIEEFFKQYGLDESCSMCLAIACKTGFPDDADESSNWANGENDETGPFVDTGASDEATQNQWVARRAALWFRRIGYGIANLSPEASFPTHHQSLPCFTSVRGGTQMGPSRGPAAAMGALVTAAPRAPDEGGSLQHSGCYMGICLHVTRLLRPIWEWTVTVGAEQMYEESSEAPIVRCRFSPDQLVMLVRPLARLKQFLSTQAPFSDAIREFQHAQNSSSGGTSFAQQVSAWVSSGRIGLPRGPSAQWLENAEIARIYQLVVRTIQGLLLMDILQTLPSMRFARLVLYLDSELRSELASMTWGQLVSSKQGKIVACALVKTLVERSPRAAARELVARLERFCPAFFSEGDALQISAFEKIAAAEHANLAQDRNEHIQEALARLRRGFQKIAPASGANIEVAQTTLRDACEKFESFGRPDAAVELALFCAECFAGQGIGALPTPEAAGASGALADMREFCYSRAVQILARCLPKGAASVSLASLQGDGAKNAGDPMQKALQLALDAKDALWHFTLYDWFLGKGFRQLLLEVRTPFIVQFLGDAVANDPRKAGPGIYEPPFHRDMHLLLQVEWLARHQEFARAAEVVQTLAKLDVRQLLTDASSSSGGPGGSSQAQSSAAQAAEHSAQPPNIRQRIKYFNMALTYGKAAQSAAHAGRGLDVFYLKDQLDVAQLQESVFFQLEGRTHAMEQEDFSEATSAMRREWAEELRARRQALKTLNWTLVDSSDLYNDYAFRFNLWESCIKIMQECDYRDMDELQTVYKNIIRECIARARVGVTEMPPLQDLIAPLHSCVLDLGRKFYVGGSRASFAFPHEYLIQGLEDLSTFFPSGATSEWDAWVVRLMLEIGIAHSDLLDAYANYNKKINSNAQPIGLAFLSEGEENDQVWYSERSKLHVASAIVALIDHFSAQQDDRIFTDPRVRDLLENLAVVVGGLHSDDIQPEARSRVNHQISDLIGKVHNN